MDFNLRFYSALKSKFKQFPMKMSSETKVGMSHFDKVELKHFDFPYYFNGKKKWATMQEASVYLDSFLK